METDDDGERGDGGPDRRTDHDHGHHDHDHGGRDHAHDHDHHAHDVSTLGISVVTVSTSRTLDDDVSGDRIVDLVQEAGHEVVTREIVNDDYDGVQRVIDRHSKRDDVDVAITNGGTGVTPDDVTVEAARPLFDKELPGFGELFRRLSYEEIGTRVVGTRAVAGVADGTPVFCLPGSENAVVLGTQEIVLPEAGHLVGLATRNEDGGGDGDEDE